MYTYMRKAPATEQNALLNMMQYAGLSASRDDTGKVARLVQNVVFNQLCTCNYADLIKKKLKTLIQRKLEEIHEVWKFLIFSN